MDSPRAGPPAGGDMGPIAAQREQSDRDRPYDFRDVTAVVDSYRDASPDSGAPG